MSANGKNAQFLRYRFRMSKPIQRWGRPFRIILICKVAVDAQAWAKEFVKIVKDNPAMPAAASYATDEETMICWFANSIMAGYDWAQKEIREINDAGHKALRKP